jgi:hypothetical protein
MDRVNEPLGYSLSIGGTAVGMYPYATSPDTRDTLRSTEGGHWTLAATSSNE